MNHPPKENTIPAGQLTNGLRELDDQIRRSTSPAETAAMVHEITRVGGTLDTLSGVLASASLWLKDQPGSADLWQQVARASDDVWEAGAELAEAAEQIRVLPAASARIRSAAARPSTIPSPAAEPWRSPAAAVQPARGR
ncbi:hypothetical protein [Kitasatospora sp. NPDC098663]|uniref:hypothetical protein n=1 Tax=Kitasatospora sp. NPDC098663 TaxID=3364096 RepID=UPI003828C56B